MQLAVVRLEPGNILRFSALLSLLIGLALLMVGGIALLLLYATGRVDKVLSVLQRMEIPHLPLHDSTLMMLVVAASLLAAAASLVLSVLALYAFNLVARTSGGIEVTCRQ
ncbi:MAG: hypothetical protein NVSMB32_01650 [Actinomycetota bacterium]